MRIIELDASGWETPLDFINALKIAIGAPEWHGSNVHAFVDSMVMGSINDIEPPYVVRIANATGRPHKVLESISVISSAIERGRADKRTRTGEDTEVSLQIAN